MKVYGLLHDLMSAWADDTSCININVSMTLVVFVSSWIWARNIRIAREPHCGSCDLFVPYSDSFPMNPEKDIHSLQRMINGFSKIIFPVFRKFYGRHGDLIKQNEISIFLMSNDTLEDNHKQYIPSIHLIFHWLMTFGTDLDLVTELDILPNFRGFHITFATDVAHQQGTLTPAETLFCPTRDLPMFSRWNQSFRNLSSFRPTSIYLYTSQKERHYLLPISYDLFI